MGDPARLLRPQYAPDRAFEVVLETDAGALQQHIEGWENLASTAIEPNPFYEHWMLLPAVRELIANDVRVLLIYAPGGLLSGVFPIVRKRSYRRLPIPNFSLWKHKYCFLCTPLLRRGFAAGALRAYMNWAGKESTAWSLLEFNQTSGEGPFAETLKAELGQVQSGEYRVESYSRAMIFPAPDDRAYLASNVSKGRRKEWRRQWNRLQERGHVEFVELDQHGEIDTWINHFMDLEASGWKGRAGSAILLEQSSRQFFSQIMREAFRRRRLMMLGLCLNGTPIALKCNIRAGVGAFAFKIAYKEEFSRYSPGLQLELETIRRIHQDRSIQWVDSCAAPNHSMIDHLWAERRKIQTVTIPTPGRLAAPIRSLLDFRNHYAQAFGKLRQKIKHAA